MTTNGKAIAMTVAGLLLAVAPRVGRTDDKTQEAKIKCSGINSCKGQGSCASASNACSGQNSCKGKGWTAATAQECKDKNGTVGVNRGAKDAPKDAPKK